VSRARSFPYTSSQVVNLALLTLPRFCNLSGPYSAGAISSIAFGARSAMVDGNVQRVLSRLTTLHANATAKLTTNFIWALADVLVPSNSSKKGKLEVGGPNKPGAWNQALMELGATVCTPKAPECGECPLSDECLAFAEVSCALLPLEPLETDLFLAIKGPLRRFSSSHCVFDTRHRRPLRPLLHHRRSRAFEPLGDDLSDGKRAQEG